MDSGYAVDNRFYPDAELVGVFQENWRLLATTANQPDFTQPYYYLQSEKVEGEPLWHLVAQPGCQINAYISSINRLVSVVNYGSLSDELFIYLSDSANRTHLKRLLIETYFPAKVSAFYHNKAKGDGYFHDLEAWLLNLPEAKKKVVRVETEEEIYVRGGLFKRLVPQVYNQTCCISGMQLGSTFGHSFVDACHIVPFSVSHDDRVTNGLALCPNIHRAFDRGLVAIDNDYTILLSSHIREITGHAYSLNNFDGKKMSLPAHGSAWPEISLLQWHRKEVFRG
jgi:putative restriction endonuclease